MTVDQDLTLIVNACDAYMAKGTTPPEEFYEIVNRHNEILSRTAARLHLQLGDENDPILPPKTLRVAASYLLHN